MRKMRENGQNALNVDGKCAVMGKVCFMQLLRGECSDFTSKFVRFYGQIDGIGCG